jgi:adenylylsulfate kinase-like enzyme
VKELVSPPWLWLFGACGAGKTATGFELYRQLGAEGHRVGFIEIDQVGSAYLTTIRSARRSRPRT